MSICWVRVALSLVLMAACSKAVPVPVTAWVRAASWARFCIRISPAAMLPCPKIFTFSAVVRLAAARFSKAWFSPTILGLNASAPVCRAISTLLSLVPATSPCMPLAARVSIRATDSSTLRLAPAATAPNLVMALEMRSTPADPACEPAARVLM